LSEPAFSFVLAKMLEQEPRNRWASTAELVRALEDIAADRVPDKVSLYAGNQYDSVLRKNRTFFRSFYRALFARSDSVRALFKNVSMSAQYRKLDMAISEAINFASHRRTAPLRQQVDKHRGLGLTAEHFEQFREAFLEALGDANIIDECSRDAWRAVLGPTLAHMSVQLSSR